jgi:7-cyano-7-deazaguanine synthase
MREPRDVSSNGKKIGASRDASRPDAIRRIHFRRKSRTTIPDAPTGGQRTAVLLLSGGLDSGTCLALLSRWGWTVHAVSFDYGQRHRVELKAARRLARCYRVASHRVLRVPDLGAIGGSALTDLATAVPKRALGKTAIPVTYVPARNTLFLSFALAVAERTGATEVVLGANALDYSGYPDCRPLFLRAFEKVARLGTKAGTEGRRISIRTPLLLMTKAEIVRLALRLGLDPALTSSCYDPSPDGTPCGACDSCLLREKGFREAGEIDLLRGRRLKI